MSAVALLGLGCGERPAYWDAEFTPSDLTQPVGLTGSVAVLDPSLNRVMMLTSPRPLALESRQFGVGRNVVSVQTSADKSRLFVLSRGIVPRFKASDEGPKLVVLDGGASPSTLKTYEQFADPFDRLDVDPLGRWLVVRGSAGVVTNPNELILIDLQDLSAAPRPKTLSSFGGKPQQLTFTGELNLPGVGARRLLIVSRETDIAIVDLDDLERDEITVQLPATAAGGVGKPLKIVYHDATPDEQNPRLAVQVGGDSSVLLLELSGSSAAGQLFSVQPSLAEVGGVPANIEFVKTDGGLRLAALVPSKLGSNKPAAVLVDPATSRTDDVPLPYAYNGIARITASVSTADGADVALLYGNAKTIAFWALGRTTGTPYRSLDAYEVDVPVSAVLDVPGDAFSDHKILKGTSGSTSARTQFYVLDLRRRLSFPMDALTDLTLEVAPDGERLWGYRAGTSQFARLTFDDLHPISLYTQRVVRGVYDIETANGRRSLVALHMPAAGGGERGIGATLFDALSPDTTRARFVTGLAFGGRP
jgi:hypothetical protein